MCIYTDVAFGGANHRNKVIKVKELNKFIKEWINGNKWK